MAELLNDEEIGLPAGRERLEQGAAVGDHHSAGGLTNADFELAKQVDDLD